jgi:hypothetical protein
VPKGDIRRDHLVKFLTGPKIMFTHNRLAALCVHRSCHPYIVRLA